MGCDVSYKFSQFPQASPSPNQKTHLRLLCFLLPNLYRSVTICFNTPGVANLSSTGIH